MAVRVTGGERLVHRAAGEDAARAEQQRVSEHRGDLLDVMRHEDQRRGVSLAAEALEELHKTLARQRVEARAGFVQDEERGSGHQRATDEDALAFALREDGPGAVGELGGFDAAQDRGGAGAVGGGGCGPRD